MIRSQGSAVSCDFSGSRRAAASEADQYAPIHVLARGRRGHAELALEFLLPLRHEPSRGDDQRPAGQPAQPQLGENQPGLDGLAQSHLVGEYRSPPHPAQRASRRLQLVVERGEVQCGN